MPFEKLLMTPINEVGNTEVEEPMKEAMRAHNATDR